MTRVLVVHHDPDIADIQADELRRAGYEVDECAGPRGGGYCPVLHGERCWQANLADVLVYDMWEVDGRPELIRHLEWLHPEKPVVLTSAGALALDWTADEASDATVMAAPSRGDLAAAIEHAVSTHHPAPRSTAHRVTLPAGARW
jgi:DNA-binding NtrC family response regulator